MRPAFLLTLAAVCAAGQSQPAWDSTGNALLNGTYSFREVLWIADEQASNTLDEAVSHYGTITFNGQGSYVINGTEYSSVNRQPRAYSVRGEYVISAAGFGYLTRARADGDEIHGLVSNGVFIGSTTESGFNGLFIAARQPAMPPTTSSFNQTYTVAYAGLPGRNLAEIRDATFRLTPNGAGQLGATAVSGFLGASYNQRSQSIAAPTYSFSGGVGTLNFGARNSQDLVSGSLQFYVAAGGGLIFGGATDGWDMLVGIRTPAGAVSGSVYDGQYYQAGLDVDRATLPNPAGLASYFGALNVIGATQQVIGHQRLQVAPDSPYEFTYSDRYTLAANGTHNDFLGFAHFVSQDGAVRIGWGAAGLPRHQHRVEGAGAVRGRPVPEPGRRRERRQLPSLHRRHRAGRSDSAVRREPGHPDARRWNLSAGAGRRQRHDQRPHRTALAGFADYGRRAVPLKPPAGGEITLRRGGLTSNRVTVYVNRTSPGVFAVPPTGLGYAAATHGDASLITPQNPARPGEVIAVYLTGLGATNPPVATGAVAPSNEPLARTDSPITVRVANRSAEIFYSGLTPTTRGLYQINFRVPEGAPAGDQYLDIGGPDTLNSQILIPVGGARAAGAQPDHAPESTRRGFSSSGSARPPSRSK